MILDVPRAVIAGLSGDAGKSFVSIGVAAALRRLGLAVAPYKKGPDYIDAAWLGAAAGHPGRNLDTFLMDEGVLCEALRPSTSSDLLLVEGNRGLYDGVDAFGTHSTATLAKRLSAPVILVADATKTTRTLAACVRGCVVVDPDVRLAAVVLNRVATARQERVVRDALADLGGPPVLGALPRFARNPLPSRHLGLTTTDEHLQRDQATEELARAVADHIDLQALLSLARSAPPARLAERHPMVMERPSARLRIGVLRDEALTFYYPENLERLEAAGAELVQVSPLRDHVLPSVDALYLGGGFPEVHAAGLSGNRSLLDSVRSAGVRGMPIYAECGGLMYLARELRVAGRSHVMAGVLDIVVEQCSRPQGHGYVEACVDAANPFYPVGTRLRGHEFHYSRLVGETSGITVLRIDRGTGVGGGRDGIVQNRVWASYLHVHALATPEWPIALLRAAGAARVGPPALSN